MGTLIYAELVAAMIFPEFLESWKQCNAWHFLGRTGAVLNWVQLRTLSRLAWDESEESNGYITVLLVFRTVLQRFDHFWTSAVVGRALIAHTWTICPFLKLLVHINADALPIC